MSDAEASKRTEFLFWDCTTAPNAKRDVHEAMYSTLAALANKYRLGGFMPGCTTPEDMLDGVFALLLPERRPVDFLASRLSDDQLMLRPAVALPSHQAAWPDGIVLALRGRVDVSRRLFRVNGLVALHDHHARDFEQSITVVPVRDSYQSRAAADNLLASDWFAGLPAMGQATAAKLQEWSDYLEWKRKLIDAGVAGARYIARALEADGVWSFVVAMGPGPARVAIDKTLKRKQLCAYSLNYSETEWVFKWADAKRGTRVSLGEMVGNPSPPDQAVEWPNDAREELPGAELFMFRYLMSDPDRTEFERQREQHGVEEACRKMEARVPEQGFLATNAEGDRSLVKRQQSEIRELRDNPGQAPFLAAYLFDVRAARLPARDDEIGPDGWLRKGMNPDQQAAVLMMLNTRELSLVQGPPGSGKTTMIAEAIHQLTLRGRKVLLASQANLAVDNALERLSDVPSIRAVRLGVNADQTQPFAEPNAAANYWKSVAATCSSRHVGAWQEQESRLRSLRLEVDDLTLLRSDSIAVADAVARSSERQASAVSSLEQARQMHEKALREIAATDDARRFLRCVQGSDESWSGGLPGWMAERLHVRLGQAQGMLDAAGLHAGPVLGEFDPLEPATQAQDMYLFSRVQGRLARSLPGIRNELQRLERSGDGPLVGAEQERRISMLKDEKTRLVERFISGDPAPDLQARMNACNAELATLERSGGLDLAWYENLFRAGIDVFDAYVTPARAAQRLALAVDAIESATTVLADAWDEAAGLIAATQREASSISALAADVTQHERVLRDVHADMLAEERHGQALLARLERAAPGQPLSLATASQACDALLASARNELSLCEAAHQETQALRAEWGPILNGWLAGLRESRSRMADGYLQQVFRNNCNVVAVTCNEARRTLHDAGHHSFDVAIIDEVSKATPPELLMSMSMARAIVLVGDHRQLPPVFKEGISAQEQLEEMEEQAAEGGEDERREVALTSENLKRYEHLVSASLFKQHFEDADPQLKSFLLTQYRMHPQIMDVVNKFYENRLRCGLSDPDGKLPDTKKEHTRLHGLTLKGPGGESYLEPDQHVLWVDSGTTPGGEPALESQGAGGGTSNSAEAALIVQMLRDIDEACASQGHGQGGNARKEVGVVSFYNRQVRIIRDLVNARTRGASGFKAIKVDVNTADNYQGKEKPIILVSLVRNPPHRLSARANTARFERINVAFSRAQELLIVVGAAEVFRNYPVRLPNLDREGVVTKRIYGEILNEISLNGGFLHPLQVIAPDTFRQMVPEPGKQQQGSRLASAPRASERPANRPGNHKRKHR